MLEQAQPTSQGSIMNFTYPYPNTLEKLKNRFWQKVVKTSETGCWIWNAGKSGKGIGQISHQGKIVGANRASWFIHFGPIPEKHRVVQTCRDNACVAPHHLALESQNTRGRQNRTSKLTEDIVRKIRQSRDTEKTLAKKYNVSDSTIGAVRRGQTWKHVV